MNTQRTLGRRASAAVAVAVLLCSGQALAARSGDYDRDGKSDIAVWRPSNGDWYVIDSSTGQTVSQQWGAPTDVPVPGDYDGDGKTDFAAWRPSNATFYVIDSSTGQIVAKPWGAPGDVPVPGDYDGDGKTDLAVWRPSTGYWYILESSTGQTVTRQWGAPTDVPVQADFDGDGKTDLAVWRPSTGTWYVIESSTGQTVSQQWGAPTDVTVPGDYDGDGKTDFAVWRPSTGYWYVLESSTGQTVSQQWGASTDVPVHGDFDGDGKADFAVWRPSSGDWYVLESSTGQVVTQQWGMPTDLPLQQTSAAIRADQSYDIGFPGPCPTGQTQLTDTGACVTLTPWAPASLPAGSRVAIQLQYATTDGAGDVVPWAKWMGVSAADGVTLDATDVGLTSRDIFTATTFVPSGDEVFDFPWYNLLASNGSYVVYDGTLVASGTLAQASMFARGFDRPSALLLEPQPWSNLQSWLNSLLKYGGEEYYAYCLNAYTGGGADVTSFPTGSAPNYGCSASGFVNFYTVN